ncbi:MAG TPA: M24 family metallopeptidase [Chloroflexota bacterium]|nr:M24 family metallopeptidase [Chloroflexota bacterium]
MSTPTDLPTAPRPLPDEPAPGPTLSLRERDRRWAAMRALMAERGLDAVLVGSFQGRERLESYLIDDFLDSIVVFPRESEPVVLSFATPRISRAFVSEERGIAPWVTDYRVGFGGAAAARVLRERGLEAGRIGLVGFGPTAPGESEGLLPLGFYQHLVESLPDATIADFTRDYTDLILVKSDEELALLRYAAGVSERACQVMLEVTRPGVSEATIYAEIMREIYRHACDVRYPMLSLHSGAANIGWGPPRWIVRAEPPRRVQAGDLVQAEIHTCYGGQEAQVQMSVAVDPIDEENQRCAEVARRAYEAGLAAVRPGATFADVVHAMEEPIRAAGCWAKTPLLHTLTFGSTGFTAANRAQLAGTREGALEGQAPPGIRRGDLVLRPGMSLELEPNACLGLRRVNLGGGVVVTADGAEELNALPTRVQHVPGT